MFDIELDATLAVPDLTLTPSLEASDIEGLVFGKTYSRHLEDGMDVVIEPDPEGGSIYAINFRYDPNRVDMDKAMSKMLNLRPEKYPYGSSDLITNTTVLEYNGGIKYDMVTLQFSSVFDRQAGWDESQKLEFAKQVREVWRLSGKNVVAGNAIA